jgi:TRAP-type C4-dicarboxylate transport system permease small subunit
MFVWIVYLGASIAIGRKAHLEVDYFIRYLPEEFYNKYVRLILSILILCFLTLVMVKGLDLANKFLLTPSYTMSFLPQGSVYMAVPVGSFFMFVNLLRVILKEYTHYDVA